MSELSPVSHIIPGDRVLPGSIGVLVPNCLAKIVDENGNSLPSGIENRGELWISGPNVMKEYLNNKTATANTINPDGFLRTGDIAMVDGNGYFYIVDRLKELIKYKGFQVPPAELEALLITHPFIADAAVIPVECPESGEIPRAYIIQKPNSNLTEEELQEWFSEKVAPHKKLRGGIKFVDSIPKNCIWKNSQKNYY